MPKTRVLIQPVIDTPNRSNFIVPLASAMRAVSSIRLLQCCFANTSYNIQVGLYDYLMVYVGTTQAVVIIPYGNYNLENLFSKMKGELDRLNLGIWSLYYDPTTYRTTISCSNAFSIVLRSTSVAYLLGFQAPPSASHSGREYTTASRTSITSDYAVRLNTNRGVLLSLKGFETMVCPNLNTSASWFVPIFASAGDLNFVSASDLGDQACVRSNEGHTLSQIEITIKRSDNGSTFELNSDASFLFEITHA